MRVEGVRNAVHHRHIAQLIHGRRFVLIMDPVFYEEIVADLAEFGGGIKAFGGIDFCIIVHDRSADFLVRGREVVDTGDCQRGFGGKIDAVESARVGKMRRNGKIVVALVIFGGVGNPGGGPIGGIDRGIVVQNDDRLRE